MGKRLCDNVWGSIELKREIDMKLKGRKSEGVKGNG